MNKVEIIEQLENEYAAKQERNNAEHIRRVAEVSSKSKELADTIEERHINLMLGVRSLKNKDAVGDMKKIMHRYNQRINNLLVKAGYPEEYLQPIYHCSICKDEGVVYKPNREYCVCFKKELTRRYTSALGFNLSENQSFDNFNENIYSDKIIEKINKTQREYMLSIKQVCQRYAESFPKNAEAKAEMLFIGKSGLGKTYLLESIAKKVAQRGFSVEYLTAYSWFKKARSAYFGDGAKEYNKIMFKPLLIIDDLGTEPLMSNITVSQLFVILNERRLKGLHTIISTNLSITELYERYTERIVSRWSDKRFCTIINFFGDDIRKSMK